MRTLFALRTLLPLTSETSTCLTQASVARGELSPLEFERETEEWKQKEYVLCLDDPPYYRGLYRGRIKDLRHLDDGMYRFPETSPLIHFLKLYPLLGPNRPTRVTLVFEGTLSLSPPVSTPPLRRYLLL